jgi:hypothetical protein
MKKFNVVAASAVALSAALASGSALANGSLTVTTANYNAASVAAAGGIITVPWNTAFASAVYQVAGGTSLEVNSRFTVTLPAGFSFASQPSITVSTPNSLAVTAGAIGNNTATFTIGNNGNAPGNAAVPAGATLTLNTVSVQGATALQTNGASLPISVQSTNNAQITNNDPLPVPGNNPAFTSNTGVSATFLGGGAAIDLASPTLGTLFVGSPDTTTADIGTVTLSSSLNTLGANGAPFNLSTADTATLTVTGLFNGIASATANGVTGTQSGNTFTFTNLPFTGNPATVSADIVLTASGKALLQQNPSGFPLPTAGQPAFAATFAPAGKTDDFIGGAVTSAPGDQISYTNGQVIPVTNFLTGDDAGYTSLLRVNNAGTVPAQLFALVQPYTGGPQLAGNLGTTLAAGTGTVFLETQIEAQVPGFTLANSGQRATLTIIGAGAGVTSVAASGLLVNPGGVVVNVN